MGSDMSWYDCPANLDLPRCPSGPKFGDVPIGWAPGRMGQPNEHQRQPLRGSRRRAAGRGVRAPGTRGRDAHLPGEDRARDVRRGRRGAQAQPAVPVMRRGAIQGREDGRGPSAVPVPELRGALQLLHAASRSLFLPCGNEAPGERMGFGQVGGAIGLVRATRRPCPARPTANRYAPWPSCVTPGLRRTPYAWSSGLLRCLARPRTYGLSASAGGKGLLQAVTNRKLEPYSDLLEPAGASSAHPRTCENLSPPCPY